MLGFGTVIGQERTLKKVQPHWLLKPSIKRVKQKLCEKLGTIKRAE